jgi:hypothetical protein
MRWARDISGGGAAVGVSGHYFLQRQQTKVLQVPAELARTQNLHHDNDPLDCVSTQVPSTFL